MSITIRDMTDYEKELLADHVSKSELREWCENEKADLIWEAWHDELKVGYTWAINQVLEKFCKEEV